MLKTQENDIKLTKVNQTTKSGTSTNVSTNAVVKRPKLTELASKKWKEAILKQSVQASVSHRGNAPMSANKKKTAQTTKATRGRGSPIVKVSQM